MLLKNKKNLILISSIAVLTLVGSGVYWLNRDDGQTDQEADIPQSIPNVPDQTTSDEVASGAEPSIKQPDNSNPNQNSPSEQEATKRNIVITRSNIKNNLLTVAAIVENAQPSDICNLVISKNGYTDVTLNNPVMFQTSYYSCKNFNYDTSQLPTSGEWQIKIIINNDTSQGQSDVQKITI